MGINAACEEVNHQGKSNLDISFLEVGRCSFLKLISSMRERARELGTPAWSSCYNHTLVAGLMGVCPGCTGRLRDLKQGLSHVAAASQSVGPLPRPGDVVGAPSVEESG